jgi:hypothetical protein
VIGICRDLGQRRGRAFKAAAEAIRSARYRMLVLTALPPGLLAC